MKKFCSNCGKAVRPNDKFCRSCGHPIKQLQAPIQEEKTISQNIPVSSNPKKNNKLIFSIAIGLLLLICAVGCSFAYIHHENNQKTIAAVDKMSPRNLAGLTITYAHLHNKNSKVWEKTYKEAKSGHLQVEKYKSYTTENGDTIKAKGDNYVYVINKRAYFTTDNPSKPSQSKLTISDGNQTTEVNTTDAYDYVQKNDGNKDLTEINNLDLTDRQLGILAGKAAEKKIRYKGYLNDVMRMVKMKDPDINYESNLKDGFSRLIGGASGGSEIEYKRENNKLIIKYLDVAYTDKNNKPASDAPERTKIFDLQKVIDECYSTPEQKREVDQMASQLKDKDQINDGEE